MNFNLFKHERGDLDTGMLDLHREKTQRIMGKPELGYLEDGFIICSNCGSRIHLEKNVPLSISKCPDCSNSNFIPFLIKDYWLYEPLGGGGMGSVYHAFDRHNSDTEYAVKILPRKMKSDSFLIESLISEARTGSKFGNHPHLTKVYEYGVWLNEYYAIYEYIEGIRLDQIIESPVKRPDSQILLWSLQILSAEQHIYDCGYLFRDLKPQNVLIDRSGNVKMIDYGLAIPAQEAINGSKADQILGSPHYIPPERIVGAPESQYSEIYSLGMLMFHMISGQTFYSSEDIKHLVEKHVLSLRMNNSLGKLPDKTNPEIVRILNKMIKRDPSQRYQSYKELGAELFMEYKKTA
ncbi:MAG: serine/threonine-protein kinase [Victivallales bacterium]